MFGLAESSEMFVRGEKLRGREGGWGGGADAEHGRERSRLVRLMVSFAGVYVDVV